MSIALLLEMAASADADRVAVVSDDQRLTVGELSGLAEGGAVARWETVPSPEEPASRWEGTFSVRDGEIRAFEVSRVA